MIKSEKDRLTEINTRLENECKLHSATQMQLQEQRNLLKDSILSVKSTEIKLNTANK